MSNYITFELKGLSGATLNNNKQYEIKDKTIKSINIDDNFKKITINIKENVNIEEKKSEIEKYAKSILINIILNNEINFHMPQIDTQLIKNNNKLIAKDKIGLRDSISIHRTLDADSMLKDICNKSKNAFDKHPLKYERILKILTIDDKSTQFLILYEYMKILLSIKYKDEKIKQKNVVEYMRKINEKDQFITFHTTTKKVNKKFEEDYFTHLRNKISHCEEHNDFNEYDKLTKQINENTIKCLLKVINNIILEL